MNITFHTCTFLIDLLKVNNKLKWIITDDVMCVLTGRFDQHYRSRFPNESNRNRWEVGQTANLGYSWAGFS